MLMTIPHSIPIAMLVCLLPGALLAQPTYKLDVKAHLKPLATVKIEQNQLVRSAVTDDPGFRLQWNLLDPAGKSVGTVEARSKASASVPAKLPPGVYRARLELFYPAYKGGNMQKGEFKPIAPELRFRLEAGTPPKLVAIEEKK